MIRAAIFDLDGVLIDTELYYLEVTQRVLRSLGVNLSLDQMQILPGASNQMFDDFFGEVLESTSVSLEELQKAMSRNFRENPVPYRDLMFDGVPQTLKTLRDWGLRLVVASNSREYEIEGALRSLRVRDYFEFLYSAEMFQNPKPNPEIYLGCIRKLGLDKSEIIVIEDSEYGITAAKAAELLCIARRENRFRFDQSKADYFVDQIPEVLNLVESLNR
jgi:HAD superfamily hydrolase (TIGR01509 family)